MGEMRILDESGDTRLMWDSDNEDELDIAKETFKKLKKKGYTAYSVKKNGDKNRVIDEFDSEAGKLIMVPGMQAG